MCNINGFCGGNWWWIIFLILLFCNCGCGNNGEYQNNGCYNNNNCGCC